jgi:hypothetical protein
MKIITFYRIWTFLTMLTRTQLCQMKPHSHILFFKFISTLLYFYILPVILFLTSSFLLFSYHHALYTPCSLHLRFAKKITMRSSLCRLPHSFVAFSPLRYKYLPQYLLILHSTFYP